MIEASNLTKEYKSGRGKVSALSRVSFTLPTGRFMAVVGKSGSGKTTLLNCVGGLERPTRGNVDCFGLEIHSLAGKDLSLFQRRDLGFVFQFGNLFSYLTVFENISFPLVLNHVHGREKDKRVLELLEKIGLREAAGARPFELSGGEIQRVSVARALAHSPRVLLADEPTASLDSVTGANLIKLMLELGQAQGCTTLVSTHDQEIIKLADEAIYLRDGQRVDRL